ncbi:MAG: spondin domain-containing protein [Acidimicrobiales bacterium]
MAASTGSTLLTMLVNTNDAFTGLDSMRLHGRGDRVRTVAYDVGSERNNELARFIPGPCCNNPFVRDPEGALIALMRASPAWVNSTLRSTVERPSGSDHRRAGVLTVGAGRPDESTARNDQA